MATRRAFTHRIHVDFSGDDGDPATLGASRCMCMAWVLSNESDVLHNVRVVSRIKAAIGCHKDAELKYKSLKKRQNKKAALDLLAEVRATVIIVPILKEAIRDRELRDPGTKSLIGLMHYFPISGLLNHLDSVHPASYFQLILDEVGWAGCQEAITDHFRKDQQLDWSRARDDWLVFGKSGGNLLLQLADVFAGLGHEYVESLLVHERPPCRVCAVRKKNRDCRYTRNNRQVGKASLMHILRPFLLANDAGEVWERGFLARPPSIKDEYLFVDCLFAGK